MERKKYKMRDTEFVTAVRIELDVEGGKFRFFHRGDWQEACRGDWLVRSRDGTQRTVKPQVFATTYTELSPGMYLKTSPVFAFQASEDGEVRTKEGITHYNGGDFVVSNDPGGSDSYAIGYDEFVRRYQLVH